MLNYTLQVWVHKNIFSRYTKIIVSKKKIKIVVGLHLNYEIILVNCKYVLSKFMRITQLIFY